MLHPSSIFYIDKQSKKPRGIRMDISAVANISEARVSLGDGIKRVTESEIPIREKLRG